MSGEVSSQDLADRARALEERAVADHPESWRPDKPELGHPQTLTGIVVEERVKPDGGYEGRPVTIVELVDLASRHWSVWLHASVLAREWEELRPVAGELVSIVYKGKVTREGAADYWGYRVVVDRSLQLGGPAQTHFHEPPAAAQPEPAPTAAEACGNCGFLGGHHAPGCPDEPPADDDIPF